MEGLPAYQPCATRTCGNWVHEGTAPSIRTTDDAPGGSRPLVLCAECSGKLVRPRVELKVITPEPRRLGRTAKAR